MFPASQKTLCLMPLQEIGYIWYEDNLIHVVTFCGGIMRVLVMLRKVVVMLTLGFRGLKLIRFFTSWALRLRGGYR